MLNDKTNYLILLVIIFCLVSAPASTAMALCTSSCSSGGCSVTLTQGSENWGMTVECDGSVTTHSGGGQYGGTICGGVTPCLARK